MKGRLGHGFSFTFLLSVWIICTLSFATKLYAQQVEVRWDVNPRQYLLYGEEGQQDVFDVFGYEVIGGQLPVPHPGLASPMDKVPEYFALFLPNRKLRVEEEFRYKRELSPDQDHRFVPFKRWVPNVVVVKGQVKRKENVNGHETYVIHQEIRAKMAGSLLEEMKRKYNPAWNYADQGKMSVDLWFDSDAGLVRKIEYDAEFEFPAVKGEGGERGSESVDENETYTLTANHRIGGTYNEKEFITERVPEAIEKGVEYLKEVQSENGSWTQDGWGHHLADQLGGTGFPSGETAIATLTVLKAEEEISSEAEEGMSWLLNQSPERTYSAALALMAMEAYKEDRFLRKMEHKFAIGEASREELKRVRENSRENESIQERFSREQLDWLERHVKFLVRIMTNQGHWTYKEDFGWEPDHSNTQYGALGLHSAARIGATINEGVWKQMLSHWIQSQANSGHGVDLQLNVLGKNQTSVSYRQKARGWTYRGQPKAEDRINKPMFGALNSTRIPMIAGAIGSVQISLTNLAKMKALSGNLRKKGKNALNDGWAWIQSHWTLRPEPNTNLWEAGWKMRHYYSLYAIERAGMFTRTRGIGGHNWYKEGAELLLSRQQEDGSWGTDGEKTVSTCFAILFLKRATAPVITLGRDQ